MFKNYVIIVLITGSPWGNILYYVTTTLFKVHKNNVFLTHSVREYLEKVSFKKSKKRNFKRLYLES